MSPQLISFKAEHLAAFIHRDGDYVESVQSAIDKERRGPAFTACIDDKILGCSGIILQWAGVGSAWAVFSQEIFKYPIWTTRTVRAALHDIMRVYKLHRVEMVILDGNNVNAGWATMLGFSRENGCSRHYTTNQRSIVRYELVRD